MWGYLLFVCLFGLSWDTVSLHSSGWNLLCRSDQPLKSRDPPALALWVVRWKVYPTTLSKLLYFQKETLHWACCNSNTWEMNTGGSRVQDHLQWAQGQPWAKWDSISKKKKKLKEEEEVQEEGRKEESLWHNKEAAVAITTTKWRAYSVMEEAERLTSRHHGAMVPPKYLGSSPPGLSLLLDSWQCKSDLSISQAGCFRPIILAA